MIPLFGNRVEFKAEENAGQLISEVSNRQSELDRGRCFFAHDGVLQYVAVAFSGEGNVLKQRIEAIKGKYPNFHMEIRNEIKTIKISSEGDVPFSVSNARRKYEEEGIIRARCGTTYLTNKNLEYVFNSVHNALFLLGNYLDTKMSEASLIKDVFVLSRNVDETTVYYLDYNKNASLKRTRTVIKRLLCYVTLVLMTLDRTEKAMTASEIMSYIKETEKEKIIVDVCKEITKEFNEYAKKKTTEEGINTLPLALKIKALKRNLHA